MSPYLGDLAAESCFDKATLYNRVRKFDPSVSDSTIYRMMKKMIDTGEIARVGRNVYYVPSHSLASYSYEYSSQAQELANYIDEKYPALDFRIFETVQLNEFVNHQIGKNTLFLSVEEGIGDFLFQELRERYNNNVLLNPSTEVYHQYWNENIIVIEKLLTESPKGEVSVWHTRLEKILVDIMADKILMESISESEYPTIYETAFAQYAVDESQMFRYAKRRSADKRIKEFLKNRTNVKLRTE